MREPYAVELRDLRYAYPDGTVALDGVDLAVAAGERVALLGPNGAGKSTLILHINGVIRGAGDVLVGGTRLADDTVRAVRSRVGLVFQDPDDQLFMTTLYDDVAFGPLNMALPAAEVDSRVHDALHAVGLAGETSRPAHHLSFGQRKRAALATVLSMRPDVLVLDEPTSNLDPRSRRAMIDLLSSLPATQLVATHDMDLAWRLCARVVLLDGGVVAADGPSSEILADERLMEAHGLELPPALARHTERG
ncbi:MAG: ABC transporter ATP-binding protein [Coriobacteriia bacterium]|nr:ABC transporter ATP-binding protein [Coriobacteriia bacterium]